MSDELLRLARDLDAAGPKAQAVLRSAMEFEGRDMKDDWRSVVAGAFRLPGAAAAISYDVSMGLRSLEVEVGYDQRAQGELGNIIEFGTSSVGPIRPAGEKVLNAGASRLERFLADLDPL